MPAPANLVQEISISAGLGNFTLTAADGRQTFNQAFGLGGTNVFDYFITSRTAGEWERGTGHLLNATTLVRDTVIESSNSDAAVNFSAGTTDVTNDVPAGNQVLLDEDQTFIGEKFFTQKLIELNDIVFPTDANADGGGLLLHGSTDKSILYIDADGEWRIFPAVESPIIGFGSLLSGPSGQWGIAGLNIDQSKFLSFESVNVLVTNAGNITLSNIDLIDATTEATIEAAIDTLANLTSVQGQTITLADAGADAFFAWDDSAGAYQNLSSVDATAILDTANTVDRGIVQFGTVFEFQSNSSNVRALESNQVWDAQIEVALTSTGNSVSWDMDTGFNFVIDTLGENTTVVNPTNTDVGKSGHLRIVQDGTGTRTVAFGSNFEFAGGAAPTASIDPAAEDMFFYKVISSTRILISSILDIS